MSFSGFADAKTVPAKAPKSKKPEVEHVEVAGLEAVASLKVVIDSLKAIQDTMMSEVKDAMMSRFAATGIMTKKAPANFRGIEGDASASCELRRRAVTSPLTEDEITLCDAHGVPTEVVTDTVETYIINPEYLSDPAVMSAVEAALKKAKGIPSDLFMKQEAKSKTVVAEGCFDKLFAQKITKSDAEAMLAVIGVPAVKATLNGDASVANAFKVAEKLLIPAEPIEIVEPAPKGKAKSAK